MTDANQWIYGNPVHDSDGMCVGTTNGLTKREYFAALAMQGHLAAQSEEHGFSPVWKRDAEGRYEKDDQGRFIAVESLASIIATAAVEQADALLAALNK